MNLTLDEMTKHRTRLRQEIMERECILAAFDIFEKYTTSGQVPKTMDLDSLVSALLPSRQVIELKEIPASPPAPAPAALPPKPPVERYIHPELRSLEFHVNGEKANLVRWSIRRMTTDFSAHDIDAMLEREGRPLEVSSISTVLSRLKSRGEIKEIKQGAGPKPGIFRCPNPPLEIPVDPAVETAESDASLVGSLAEQIN